MAWLPRRSLQVGGVGNRVSDSHGQRIGSSARVDAPTRRGHRGWRRRQTHGRARSETHAPERLGYLGLVKPIANDGRTESCRNEAMHFAGARMSFEGRLREEQLAIQRHLETATAAWQQHRPRDPRRPRVEELSHQTGGSIRVVSDDAELDLEFMRSVGRLGLHARTLRREA
jgi:hypothetical protein